MKKTITETDNNLAQIESGIEQINSALTQINEGSLTITEALAALKSQQLSGMLEISSGLSQIISAQGTIQMAESQMDAAKEQLDTAKDQIESQKESALQQGKISITMEMLSQILMAQNFSMPAGYITDGDIEYMVKIGDKLTSLEETANLLLFDIDGVGEIRLSDIADVYISDNSADVYAKIDNVDGIILSFSKQSEYATATVSENVAKRFDELSKKYEGLSFVNLSDQGDYIDIIVNTVLENLYLGAIFAVVILLLFLKDIKPTLIVACSIPVSLLFAIVLMYFSGITLNVISLSGLAIGIGMLVDNSIVVIENIYRMRNEGETAVRAAVYGAKQVAGAITSSTLTTVCVFLPIVFVQGLTRQIFTDMALTIGYSLFASLIVAITLVPALSAKLIEKPSKQRSHKIFDVIVKGYSKAAEFSLSHKWICIVLSVVLLFTSVFALLSKGFIYMPSMSGQQISITVTMPEDTEFEETKEVSGEIMGRIMEIEGVETIGGFTGGGNLLGLSLSGGSEASTSVSMYAIISPDAGRKDAEVSKEIVEKCSDLNCTITATGAMDMSSMMGALGGGNSVAVTLYSDDIDLLTIEAENLGNELLSVEGVSSVNNGLQDTTPEMRIVVNKDKAMAKGLTVAQVYTYVAAELSTELTASSISIEGTNIDTVIYSADSDKTVNDLKNLKISVTSPVDGSKSEVKLSDIAEFKDTVSLNSISRDNQRRFIKVSANVDENYNITNTASAVEAKLKNYQLPSGVTMEIGGQSSTIMDALGQLVNMLLLAVAIIYLIMVAQFQSFKSPFIVMFTIPLAFTGGFIALLMFDMELSIVSMVGFIMLSGIIVNNGIVLIDYINTLRLSGMEKREAILLAGKTRMRPILMTALTTVMGLLFMAAANGLGSELMQPLALVSIGGLLYGTLMTLFVVPALYDIFNKKELKKVIIDEEDEKDTASVL
ncbi:MAG: efflux RND transporter permease subunit [Clostridia bacterium]|nr:efflux RND transporter permease subunit [Clostridia bacterium]